MFRRAISLILCGFMILALFPVEAFAADDSYRLPIRDEMESTNGIFDLDPANVFLVQDRVSGNYAVKVSYEDIPNVTSAKFTLTKSDVFDIKKYSQIKLWVKPGPGANWIKFYTNGSIAAGDKNSDGIFKVGEDLISGKWNGVTLDLSKLAVTSGKDLVVETNEYSSWIFDEVHAIYTPLNTIDLTKMVNSQTEIVNGQVQFKKNNGIFDITPTVLTSQRSSSDIPQAAFTRASVAYKQDGMQAASGAPRYENGGVRIEEGTTNLLTGNQASVETDITGFNSYSDTATITRDTSEKWQGNASLKVVVPGVIDREGFYIATPTNVSRLTTYTGSLYIKGSGTVKIDLYHNTSTGALDTKTVTLTGSWQRIVLTGTTGNEDLALRIYVRTNGVQAATFYADGLQIEQKPYATSWQMGGVTRSAETLSIPTAGILNPTGFTWEQMVYVNASSKRKIGNSYPTLFYIPRSGNSTGVWLYHNTTSDEWVLQTKNDGNEETSVFAADSYTPEGWHRFAVRVGTNKADLWIDGVLRGTINNPKLPSAFYATALIGYNSNGYADTIHKDICISNIARPDAQMQERGTSTGSLPTDVNTTLKLSLSGKLSGESNDILNGKISNIFIDSGYVNTAGTPTSLSAQRTFLPGVKPTVMGISGDGKKVYYANPSDGSKLYLLDLITGENKKVSTTFTLVPLAIKVNENGSKAAVKVQGSSSVKFDIYACDSNGSAGVFKSDLTASDDFDIQADGTIYATYAGFLWGGASVSDVKSFTLAKKANTAFYVTLSDGIYSLYKYLYTPSGWKGDLVTKSSRSIALTAANPDGSCLIARVGLDLYGFDVASKAFRMLDFNATSVRIAGITSDNKVIYQDDKYRIRSYDLDTDTITEIRPGDAVNPPDITTQYFDVDYAGNKMVYTASSGLSTSYIKGVQRPERYLFSFDGKNSWHTYKDGKWKVAATGAAPSETDLQAYGMTIDEVNGMTPADFEGLYIDGREITQFDVVVYFASVDPYTSPALKGIKVTLNSGQAGSDELVLERYLYTAKEQGFDSEKWRKIKKIYPVEMFPREADSRYFIRSDSGYKSYKNNQWNTVEEALLSDVENNWISITQQGMTGDELKKVSETSLKDLLPSEQIRVVYALKVEDLSTEAYSSSIAVDYVENMFDASTLTLKINFMDGTAKEYPGLDKEDAENFMEWLKGRQFNNGPIFYTIKSVNGGVEVNDFISYYTIKSVSVDDSTPEA